MLLESTHGIKGKPCKCKRLRASLYLVESRCVCDFYYWTGAIWQFASNKNLKRNTDSTKYKGTLMLFELTEVEDWKGDAYCRCGFHFIILFE